MADPTPTPDATDNPFAQTAPTPDGMIATLRKRAVGDPELLARASAGEVEHALERAVRAVWAASRIKVFVPVFALRSVREELGVGGAADAAPAPDAGLAFPPRLPRRAADPAPAPRNVPTL